MLVKGIVLKCFSHIKDERTSAAIYHMLHGKRSIQTIHDAHLYNLAHFYGIYRNLDQQHFNKIVTDLTQANFLSEVSKTEPVFLLTEQGKNWLIKNEDHIPYHYYNGLKYYSIDLVFFERLLLLIQVLTNSKMKNTSYIPIIDKPDIIEWVKLAYTSYKQDIEKNLQLLYEELHNILSRFPNEQVMIFVERLTGFKTYSMSLQQLATFYHLPSYDIHILLVGIIHQILNIINENEQNYPFLGAIIDDLSTSQAMTQSASITRKLLDKGHNIEMIANIRKLTVNTIQDHIVEITLHSDDFVIDPYVNELEKHVIIQAIEHSKTTKLRNIKEYLSDEIDYFQIRLILATYKKTFKVDGEQ